MITTDYVASTVLFLTSFFSLMNPLGVMPVFLSMTNELTSVERNRIALKAVFISFLILVAFAFLGQFLFDFFGISVPSFRIAGGIVLFILGYDMLQARLGKTKMDHNEALAVETDISVTPLAIPLISGPGAISNAIIMMEGSKTIELKILLIASIFIISLMTYLVLWGSGKITKILGETGNKVMMRLMGLIVMVIAVEFFFGGLKPFLQDILNK